VRELINIVENAQGVFYHGSRNELAIGTVLTARSEGYVNGSGMDDLEREAHFRTEEILEQHRPTGANSRKTAVFMVIDPDDIDYAGGYNDYVYVVEPLGPVTKCNLAWYSELYNHCFDEVKEAEAAELAKRYWAAEPKDDGDLYEFLTTKARITSAI
jgi:hypothetical protein